MTTLQEKLERLSPEHRREVDRLADEFRAEARAYRRRRGWRWKIPALAGVLVLTGFFLAVWLGLPFALWLIACATTCGAVIVLVPLRFWPAAGSVLVSIMLMLAGGLLLGVLS